MRENINLTVNYIKGNVESFNNCDYFVTGDNLIVSTKTTSNVDTDEPLLHKSFKVIKLSDVSRYTEIIKTRKYEIE